MATDSVAVAHFNFDVAGLKKKVNWSEREPQFSPPFRMMTRGTLRRI
jgi:hypothetical protein